MRGIASMPLQIGFGPVHTSTFFCLTIKTHLHSPEHNNLSFSILPKQTLVCRLEQPGINQLSFRLADDLLYLLSHSHQISEPQHHCCELGTIIFSQGVVC